MVDKKLYQKSQEMFCAGPKTCMCTCHNVGDEFETEYLSAEPNGKITK